MNKIAILRRERLLRYDQTSGNQAKGVIFSLWTIVDRISEISFFHRDPITRDFQHMHINMN